MWVWLRSGRGVVVGPPWCSACDLLFQCDGYLVVAFCAFGAPPEACFGDVVVVVVGEYSGVDDPVDEGFDGGVCVWRVCSSGGGVSDLNEDVLHGWDWCELACR